MRQGCDLLFADAIDRRAQVWKDLITGYVQFADNFRRRQLRDVCRAGIRGVSALGQARPSPKEEGQPRHDEACPLVLHINL